VLSRKSNTLFLETQGFKLSGIVMRGIQMGVRLKLLSTYNPVRFRLRRCPRPPLRRLVVGPVARPRVCPRVCPLPWSPSRRLGWGRCRKEIRSLAKLVPVFAVAAVAPPLCPSSRRVGEGPLPNGPAEKPGWDCLGL